MDRDTVYEFMIFNISGIPVGIDTESVIEICDRDSFDAESDLTLSFDNSEGDTALADRVVVVDYQGKREGINISMPEEIISVPSGMIRPLPGIFGCCKDTLLIWGVTLRNGRIILLLDMGKYIGRARGFETGIQ